jgi:hypothetical protein
MPEHDPEQELGPKITSALQNQVDEQTSLRNQGLASEARRRVRKRRQSWTMAAAAAVLVAAGIGGVWTATNGSSPVASNAGDSGESKAAGPDRSAQGVVPSQAETGCPANHPIVRAAGRNDVPAGTGLDVSTPVTGLVACRYQLTSGSLLGRQGFSAEVAQQVVDAIKVLPERNPALPAFKCAPQATHPAEAIVLRFTTSAGIREIWVQYDGCLSAGFSTGTHSYGLYAAPLKLFMTGPVRPSGSLYLNALEGW